MKESSFGGMAMLAVLALGLAADLALWSSSSSSDQHIVDDVLERRSSEPGGVSTAVVPVAAPVVVPASDMGDASDSGVPVERVRSSVRSDRLPVDSLVFTSAP